MCIRDSAEPERCQRIGDEQQQGKDEQQRADVARDRFIDRQDGDAEAGEVEGGERQLASAR